MDKASLRKKYKKLRSSLTKDLIETKSLDIANNALKLPIWEETNYHIFLTIEDKAEVDTSFLLHILQGKDKSIGVSKSNFSEASLQHILLQENTLFKISEYGIPEPVGGITLEASFFDVVFVPVLAYDINGNRIGYGKGFYDRFLKQCKSSCKFIGLSFFEPENEIPYNEFDIPLSMVITPNNVYYPI